MKELLESLLTKVIKDFDEGKIDDRVVSYSNYDSNYLFLKPRVVVEVELTNGKTAKIDVTDYFEGVVK